MIEPGPDPFLTACRNAPTGTVPVWFMRQAGRSLPEYRALRERHSTLEICLTPELAIEATLQPVRRLGVDAAILFSDIVVPLVAMGVEVDIAEGRGPVVANPIRTAADVGRLRPPEPGGVDQVNAAIAALHVQLEVPLIGFAGAPFTLASYLIEGGASRNHARTKAMMHNDPAAWRKLMDVLAETTLTYLEAQITAGADAIQLFDSWAGALSPQDYRAHVMPASERILRGLQHHGVPRIHFGVNTGELLPAMAGAGADVVGVDWRVPLDEARRRTGGNVALQGNLDPALCLAPWPVVQEAARDVLTRGGGRGHIFNLGHGVLPETDPGVLARLVDFVHDWEHGDG